MRADWTISRVAGIEPGARSIQRLEVAFLESNFFQLASRAVKAIVRNAV